MIRVSNGVSLGAKLAPLPAVFRLLAEAKLDVRSLCWMLCVF